MNYKVSNSKVIWFERYRKEKLFQMKKRASMNLDAPMNSPDRVVYLSACSEYPLSAQETAGITKNTNNYYQQYH